ncbi:hypothetical protein HYPSUDRAFT_467861 [Hypholoma sublateritium FD-334 SS-4]|uniref:HMG box domain-containing protein n=1 Tax=Hypholoma sublateritium (strain FD-334 SS-4) TaxID=945553 RepID=A0A0D2KHB8_HYPSF|nr:hypothetical protein HYPSUDRAFT_467861 [Hypholoma sublateritium FD-334 SS-4]
MSLYNNEGPQWPTGQSNTARDFSFENNYAIYPWNHEATLSPYSSFPSPDPLAYSTTDTLASSPTSSCTSYPSDSSEPITSHFPPALKHNRKSPSHPRDPSHIRRPRNAFFVFRSAFISAQKQAGKGLQHELSKQAARVWNSMTDAEKYTYQETARMEQMLHKIEHPDYQYSPSPKGTRTRKPTRVAVPSQTVSPCTLPLLALPERAEFTFSQLRMGDAKVDHANILIDGLPPSLEFGTNTLLLADSFATSEPLSGQVDCYLQTPFPLADLCYPDAIDGVSPLARDYGLQNFEFNPDDYLSNRFLTFH